jgi:acetyl-CoA carboxylase biotin carboxyl carrier protein
VTAEGTAGPSRRPRPDRSAAGAGSRGDIDASGAPVPDTASLLALVEQLSRALERSDLIELEVEAGGTAIVLRKPAAVAQAAAGQAPLDGAPAAAPSAPATAEGGSEPERPSVKAPLTGIFYSAPAPGSAPYVTVGAQVSVGQVIGLIEAMKLFNEIKSDLAGRVVRVVPETGTLVKAKQPLIEVETL